MLAKPLMQWLRTPPRLISVITAMESRQFDLAEKQLTEILARLRLKPIDACTIASQPFRSGLRQYR